MQLIRNSKMEKCVFFWYNIIFYSTINRTDKFSLYYTIKATEIITLTKQCSQTTYIR